MRQCDAMNAQKRVLQCDEARRTVVKNRDKNVNGYLLVSEQMCEGAAHLQRLWVALHGHALAARVVAVHG